MRESFARPTFPCASGCVRENSARTFIIAEHVHVPADLEPLQTSANSSEKSTTMHHSHHDENDLSLASAVKRHVRFVYQQANQNQRRTAKLLGISRATLSRHLREQNH